MSNFDSMAEGEVRIIQFADTQLLDEAYCHSIGCNLTNVVNNMNETAILINMSKVKLMASAMIGKLVLLRNFCQQKEIGFGICELNDDVLEAIQLMRIDQILNVHPTQQDGLNSFTA